MTTRQKSHESADQKLKGNIMLGRKVTLRPYENANVNCMVEFWLGESDYVKEAEKLMRSIESIVEMAKKKWS